MAALDTLVADAITSLACLRESSREGANRIFLFGVSMGTMITMAQAVEAPHDVVGMMIEGIVELNVLADIGYEFMGIRPSPEASQLIPVEMNPLLTAPRTTIPRLFPQSIEDEVTPIDGARRLVELSPEPKRFVTVVGIHGLGVSMDPDFSHKVNSFLDKVAAFPAE